MASPKPVSKPLKDSGGHVRVKPAAKNVPNNPDASKILDKSLRRSFGAEGEERSGRKEKIQIKKLPNKAPSATRPSNFGSGADRVKVNSNPVKTSGLQGRSGALGGQHMGGHGVGLGGMAHNFGGGGIPEQQK